MGDQQIAEIWLPIDGEPEYEVSNLGRVRSLDMTRNFMRWGFPMVRRLKGRVLKPFRSSLYLAIRFRMGGETFYMHRLVAAAFLPGDPARPEVNHKDGDKRNNAVSNLEWATRGENVRHSSRVLGNRRGQFAPSENGVRMRVA